MKRSALTNSDRARDILTRTLRITFTPTDELVLVVSMPALRTEHPKFEAAVKAATDENDAQELLAGFLATVLTSWNLEEEDGSPSPLTADYIAHELQPLELEVMLAVLQQELAGESGKALSSKSSKRSTKQAKTARKR